jgi:ankyrin repeat protein
LKVTCLIDNDYVLSELMKNQFNIQVTDELGKNLLHYAALGGSFKCATVLLEFGVSANV